MRLFWMAWGFAILLILIAVGATGWVFTASEQWPDFPRIAARALCLVGSMAAFVGAFRLALLATASLRFVLAQNLAALIVMELDDLRRATQERAAILAAEGGEIRDVNAGFWRASETLEIPLFFGEREEIRRLLGVATEHTLEELLASLQSYNQAVAEVKSQTADRNAVHRLWHEIAIVQERLRLAAREVAPFYLAS